MIATMTTTIMSSTKVKPRCGYDMGRCSVAIISVSLRVVALPEGANGTSCADAFVQNLHAGHAKSGRLARGRGGALVDLIVAHKGYIDLADDAGLVQAGKDVRVVHQSVVVEIQRRLA